MQLQAAGLLEGERAAAAHSAPGDAFERVYGKVAGRVRARVEAADPVLAQWIQARPAGSCERCCCCSAGACRKAAGFVRTKWIHLQGPGSVYLQTSAGAGARRCGRWAGACLLLPAACQTCL